MTKTKIIRIPKKGDYSLNLGKGSGKVTKKAAVKKWVAGYMEGARDHKTVYHEKGIHNLLFVHGKTRIKRRI